jgi:hypothetical protein
MSFPLKTKRDSWTEDQVLALPLGEPDAFDRKSGRLLSKPNFEEDLGKALSAFANSGGGHLLLGVEDDGTFDGVPWMTKKGRTTTREWLEQKIPALLDRPLQDFKVHEVVPSSPSGIPAGQVVIVIDVGDSNLAPHQNASNRIYYHRVGGHSLPAPHFYLDILWRRVTFPTGEVVRAWFDTVINPLIEALRNERRTMHKQRWVWDRFNQSTIDGMRLLSSLSENLEQFVLLHSDVCGLLRQHDDAVLRLISSVRAFYEEVKDSTELKSVYEEATKPDMIRIMVEANPHNSLFPNSNDQQILESILGREEADRWGTLAQAIVNETGEIHPGTGIGHAPFWNLHRDKLIEVGRSGRFDDFRERANEALGNLYIAIESVEKRLRDIREELGRKHGQPYVTETPSYGMESSMGGFYR